MRQVTAVELSNYVKQKLVEIGELSIVTAQQHAAFVNCP